MKWSRLFLTEVLHWGGLLLAVVLIYMLLNAGNIPRATTGMVTLLLFALVTFLYGYTWIGDSWGEGSFSVSATWS